MISSALTAATLVAYAGHAHATGPWTEWDSQNNFTHSSDGTNTVINTTANRAGGDSRNLDIDAHESVRVNQVSSNGLFYGRAADDADPTRILGSLSSNGRILIIDRNGVFFGANSQVDTAGLIATTGDISNDQIMNNDFGNYTIENMNGTGSIEMNGQITIADAGLAAFVAPTVKNNGVINAKLGKVAFASGEKVTLDLYGDKLVEIEVAGDGADALLENTGTIAAEGGYIQMSAASAKQAVDNIINVEGVVTASSATRQGGKIVLGGGDKGVVKVSGKVDASGTDGGSIEATGENVHITQTAELSVDGGAGSDGQGDGGEAYVYGNKYAIFEGSLTGRGGDTEGDGGNAEISARDSVGYYGLTDLGATNGAAGTLLIDPEHLTISSAGLSADIWATLSLGLYGTININDQALANALHNNHVNLWATETLSVTNDIDISEYDYTTGILFWKTHHNGITQNNLSLAAPSVSILGDITLGTGELHIRDMSSADSVLGFDIVNPPGDIIVDELNLNGRIYRRETLGDNAFETLALDSQINTTANTINVLSNNALIQQAIQFAAGNGETINVHAGTYAEAVAVNKSVHLYGAADHASIINPNSPGFTVTANGAIVDGFAIDGAGGSNGYGVWVTGASDVTVSNNLITNSSVNGIRGNNTQGLTLDNNEIIGTNGGNRHDGISLYASHDAVITNNIISNTGMDAIYLNGSQRAEITGNTATDFADSGITFHNGSHGGHAEGNTITGGGKSGFWLQSNNLTIVNNDISGSGQHGIYSTGNSQNITAEENDMGLS